MKQPKWDMTPASLWGLSWDMAMLGWHSQTVMTLRTLGMMGAWPVSPGENEKMWTEKPAAFTDAYWGALTAMSRHASPDQIVRAALKPVAKVASANAKRLTGAK